MSNRYGPRIVTDGLVLCLDAADRNSYPLSGDIWYDLSGNGNNGTFGPSTAAPTFSSGNGGALVFDGSNDYVSINLNKSVQVNSSSSSATTYQWTIMLYYKSNNILTDPLATSPRHTLFSFNDNTFNANGYNYLDLELWNDDYVFFNGNGTTNNQGALVSNTRGSNNTGNFNLATMTISGNIITTYHNNISTARSSRSSTSSMSSSYFMLGSRGNDNRLNGYISSAYLYNKVLSASEILQNYNATKGRFGL